MPDTVTYSESEWSDEIGSSVSGVSYFERKADELYKKHLLSQKPGFQSGNSPSRDTGLSESSFQDVPEQMNRRTIGPVWSFPLIALSKKEERETIKRRR
jgi:hypothetical protein